MLGKKKEKLLGKLLRNHEKASKYLIEVIDNLYPVNTIVILDCNPELEGRIWRRGAGSHPDEVLVSINGSHADYFYVGRLTKKEIAS